MKYIAILSTVFFAGLIGALADSGRSFVLLSPKQTGLDFANHWTPESDLEKALFDSAFTGGGVALGDYNGDGLIDIFLTRAFGGNRLFRNLGKLEFQDVTKAAGLIAELDLKAWGTGSCFADINNDGFLDLYVCANLRPNRLYLNNQDGTFRECAKEYGLDFSGASITAAFADYDLDGDLDVYLVTNRKPSITPPATFTVNHRAGRMRVPEEWEDVHDVVMRPDGSAQLVLAGQRDRLYRNDGTSFTDVSITALGDAAFDNYQGLAARWWDFDGDRYPDLYVSNDFWGPDHLLKNQGDGTFVNVAESSLPYMPWFSMGSDAADINNDGRLDLLAADMAATTHFKQKLNMGDMEKNGWFLQHSKPNQFMANCLYLNTGTKRFLEVSEIAGVASSDWTWNVNFSDFDNDGWMDLYLTNGMTRNWFDGDMASRAAEQRSTKSLGWLKRWQNEPRLNEANLAYRNLGNLDFDNVSTEWKLDATGISFGSATGDLDNDGDIDLVTINFDDEVHLYRNDLSDNNYIKFELQGTESNRMGLGAWVTIDLENGSQMRELTATRGFMSAGPCAAHFGLGKAAQVKRAVINWPSGCSQIIESPEVNRKHLIVEAGTKRNSRIDPPSSKIFTKDPQFPELHHREIPHNDFASQPLLPNKLSQFGPGIAVGDIDNDGLDDLYLPGGTGQAGQIMKQTSAGQWQVDSASFATFFKDRQLEQMAALFIEVDGDGDLDLFVSSGGVEQAAGHVSYQNRLYLNNGKGLFSPAPEGSIPSDATSSAAVASADFDRDGDLDLFIGGRSVPEAYPTSPKSSLLLNNNGRFTEAIDIVAPKMADCGMVTGALWSDVDQDGWIDLLISTDWGPIQLWINQNGKLYEATSQSGLANYRGWWTGISSGDFDNDGDPDYVATNFGLNSKYHPTSKKPVMLFYGDVDGSGNQSILEAKYYGNQLLPIRGKSCSTQAMPSLAEKFKSFSSFAAASLPEIYDQEKIDGADRLEANHLETSLLINQGNRQFTVVALSRLVQVAPSFGSAVSDFNSDGFQDVALLQNFSFPQPETRRMNAGLGQLLLGKGDGSFDVIPTDQSGLMVHQDGRALTVFDANGDNQPDLLATINGAAWQIFLNQTTSNNRRKIKLIGAKGNPTAIGASVTQVFSDGSKQLMEIKSGGGYLSQSANFNTLTNSPKMQLKSVHVRWPDGSESNQSITEPDGDLVLKR